VFAMSFLTLEFHSKSANLYIHQQSNIFVSLKVTKNLKKQSNIFIFKSTYICLAYDTTRLVAILAQNPFHSYGNRLAAQHIEWTKMFFFYNKIFRWVELQNLATLKLILSENIV
jgi:hypothetical protein